MTLTVVSHFYNEEVLLPFWLAHHTRLFDHGIMIDYQSTDHSVAEIRRLAPTWEIRPSHNQEFDAELCDAEVMEVERLIPGWKIVLNTTEFLLQPNLRDYVSELEKRSPGQIGVWSRCVMMVDTPSTRQRTIRSGQDLVLQCENGIILPVAAHSPRSGRLLHSAETGRYTPGRHTSNHVNVEYDPTLFLLWFGWSPFEQVRKRKLQVQHRISARDKQLGRGREHVVTESQLDQQFDELSKISQPLQANGDYARALEAWKTCSFPQ